MAYKRHSPTAGRRAKQLRKEMTPEELAVWEAVRGGRLGVRFRRQHPIGPYIVDFVALRVRLVVEIDGMHHELSAHDERRDAFLRDRGFTVLRLWNDEVLDPHWTETRIAGALEALT